MKKVIIIVAAVVLVAVAAVIVVPLLGGSDTTAHNEYVADYQDPTCGQEGYEHIVCDCGCGLDYMRTYPARGEHNFNRIPTCTEDAVCSECGYTEENCHFFSSILPTIITIFCSVACIVCTSSSAIAGTC